MIPGIAELVLTAAVGAACAGLESPQWQHRERCERLLKSELLPWASPVCARWRAGPESTQRCQRVLRYAEWWALWPGPVEKLPPIWHLPHQTRLATKGEPQRATCLMLLLWDRIYGRDICDDILCAMWVNERRWREWEEDPNRAGWRP